MEWLLASRTSAVSYCILECTVASQLKEKIFKRSTAEWILIRLLSITFWSWLIVICDACHIIHWVALQNCSMNQCSRFWCLVQCFPQYTTVRDALAFINACTLFPVFYLGSFGIIRVIVNSSSLFLSKDLHQIHLQEATSQLLNTYRISHYHDQVKKWKNQTIAINTRGIDFQRKCCTFATLLPFLYIFIYKHINICF